MVRSSCRYYAFYFLVRILVCKCTICLYGKISISCTIPSEGLFSSSRTSFYTFFSQHLFFGRLMVFSCDILLIVFHCSLSDHKSPQVCSYLSCILKNTGVWMVSTHPLIFKFFSSYTNPLLTVPSATIRIGTTATFMLHSFLKFSSKV